MEQKQKILKIKTEARKLLRECFYIDNPFMLLSLIPFEIWKHIMNVANLKSIVFLSQTCWGFHLLFENLQETNVTIATRLRKEGQIPLALKSLQKCANNGNGIAMVHLGYACRLKQNKLEQEIMWFKKAASCGNSSGMALYSSKLACCENSSVMALYSSKLSYDGIRKHKELSDIWAQKALASNDPFAIGYCYYYGLGIPNNATKAFKYFETSAKEGNEYGQHMLATCFYYGYGTKNDHEKAFDWYLKSAEQGNARSQHMMSRMYRYGDGCDNNEFEANIWSKKADLQNKI